MAIYAYTWAQWLAFLYIYSFMGWIWECCYVSLKEHKLTNRGFLYGPFLPIYGFGALIILIAVIPVKNSLVLIFLCGLVAATVLEYYTGMIMERLFHVRYWDYSQEPFHLQGYICLKSSIAWGVFSVLMIRFVHIPIERLVVSIPMMQINIMAIGIGAIWLVDISMSVHAAMRLKQLLLTMAENNAELRRLKKRADVLAAILDAEKEELRILLEKKREDFEERKEELLSYKKQEQKHLQELQFHKVRFSKREQMESLWQQLQEKPKKLAEIEGYVQQIANLHKIHTDEIRQKQHEKWEQEIFEINEKLTILAKKLEYKTEKQAQSILRRNKAMVSFDYEEELNELRKDYEQKINRKG